MEPITWVVVVPLAFASLLTSLLEALGTPWGLVRHYWVLFKLLLTVVATTVLMMNTQTVAALANLAAATEGADVRGLQGQLLHAAGGMLVLLVTTVLALYKPRGMTGYGWRKRHEQRATLHP